MSIHRHALTVTLLATTLLAQEPKEEKVEPVLLVSRAERLLHKKELEDAVLMLWQALGQLAALPSNPVHDATAMSARYLLKENDPREAQRRATFTSVARQQVELAVAYRAKKWLDTASTRLDVADRFDREVGAKERAGLDAARAKTRTAPAATPAVMPKEEPKAKQSRLSPLLQRSNTPRIFGEWREVDDCLELAARTGEEGVLAEWVPTSQHEDHDIVVEWKPAEPAKDHTGGLWIGFDGALREANGYHARFLYDAKYKNYWMCLSDYSRLDKPDIGEALVIVPPTADGFHRFSVQVRGTSVRLQIDGAKPLELTTPAPARGQVGLCVGIKGRASCAVQYRSLRIDPLPADRLTDDELRAKDEAENQNAITKAVDEAKQLLAKKQPEPASLLLREAIDRVADLPAGVLRDNLHKSIEAMLAQADPLAPRRKKAAQTIATELVTLADEYAKAGLVRAALVVVEHAAGFDPEGLAARLAAAEDAVRQWNVAQATARASELAPPADDGAVLREWFAKGRRLDTRGPGFVVDGASARAVALMGDAFATWVPQPLAPKLEKFSVYVHLPAPGVQAGVLFDVVDSSNFGVLFLDREAKVMRLHAYLKLGGKWVPLLQRDVLMDAWRRDGWHQITVEANATGLIATCGNAKIQVPRQMMGKVTGVPGLYAGCETADAVTVEFRAFAAGK